MIMSQEINKQAMAEIVEVLRKHDLMSHIIVCDGEGMSEFAYFVPSWSIHTVGNKGFVIANSHLEPEVKLLNTDKTINGLVHIIDNLTVQLANYNQLMQFYKDRFEVITSKDMNKH